MNIANKPIPNPIQPKIATKINKQLNYQINNWLYKRQHVNFFLSRTNNANILLLVLNSGIVHSKISCKSRER